MEIIIVFLLLVANGIFAMSEMAVVAARKIRLQHSADSGDKRAQTALKLARNPNQFLATIQIGITLVGIFAGAFGGATIAKKLGAYLNTFPRFAPYSDIVSVGAVVVVITYLSLIIGELVPKRLALNNPERVACLMAPPMKFLSRIALSVVRLLEISTDFAIRLLGVKPVHRPVVTHEEIKGLIEQGKKSGIFDEAEQDMIESVLRLDDQTVGGAMIPRTKIAWVNIDEPLEDIRYNLVQYDYSRFPVAKGNLENILGVVRAKDILSQSLSRQPLDLKVLLRPPLFVHENMSSLNVLKLFKQKGTHIALVTDEYGSIEGMITHNDIFEDIVGHIPTAGESSVEPQAKQKKDGSWLVDGLLNIDDLKEILQTVELPNEKEGKYHTVGGLMISRLQSIPAAGQYFEWQGLRFEVVNMDGRRVDKVLIVPIAQKGILNEVEEV